MNHTCFILFFFLLIFQCFGQENLILNGDFEEYWQCPDDATQIERCRYVYNPCEITICTSDYFNSCFIPPGSGGFVDVPNAFSGYQNSRSGNGFVGFGCLDDPGFHYREYVQLSFMKPLECGQKYLIEGYFNLANVYRYTIKNIGFLFSEDKFQANDFLYKSYTPQIVDSLTLIDDTLNWVKLAFEYIAEGPHSYLTIGHWLNDSTDSYFEVNPNAISQSYGSYFYLEDFSIIKVEPEAVEIPNVFTPNSDGVNDYFEFNVDGLSHIQSITIFNRWGNIINTLDMPIFWDGKDSQGHSVTDGIYFYLTHTKESCKQQKEYSGMIHLIR